MRVHSYARPVLGLSAVRSRTFRKLFDEYERRLLRDGFNAKAVRLHLDAVAHFGVWHARGHRRLTTIDEETLSAFARHRSTCRCPGTSRNRARQVVSCVRRFFQHLRERGVLPIVEVRLQHSRLIEGFLRWMQIHRGVAETTLTNYGRYAEHVVCVLGEDPQAYTARGLRHFVAQQYRHYRRNSSRMVLAAVRMFLRYLALEGHCRAGLEHALTPRANWSQSSLPRGLSAEENGRVLAACPSTPRGLRDRAVLLLLIRLGLRTGDVAKLRFTALCFDTATIRVSGKGAREVRLPLPQDAGDALLAYLRAGRPRVPSEFVFLRSVAPFTPFAGRQAGHGIGRIARAALQRAAVQPPSRGAHVFRHTAACQLLREGVGLEGIAAVLRHRSIETGTSA